MDGVVIRSLLGLVAFGVLASTRSLWPWGLATLVWVAYTIYYGATYVIEPVKRATHPRLYWFVTVTWAAVAIAMVLEDSPGIR